MSLNKRYLVHLNTSYGEEIDLYGHTVLKEDELQLFLNKLSNPTNDTGDFFLGPDDSISIHKND